MKKVLLSLPVIVLGIALLLPAQSASAHSYHNKDSKKERKEYRQKTRAERREMRKQYRCERLEKREIRAWHRFNQNKDRSVNRVQKLINRQAHLGCMPNGTIVEQLLERGQFKTLATALTEAGLVDTLNSSGDFTVFAPTDQAFAKLGQDTINAVLADPTLLTNILTYHVVDPADVPNAVPSSVAVTLSSAPMLNGQNVSIELRGGDLFIDDSKVIVTDLQTTNGIVHVIDTVLMP